MHLFSYSAKPFAALKETVRVSHGRTADKRMAALIFGIVLLAGLPRLYAQGRMATSSLVLQVRPEALLQDRNGSIVVKVRLARGTTARLWMANSCTPASRESHIITFSGIYTIPHGALTPVSNNPSGGATQVCLASSDGVLNDSLQVEILEAANGTPVQGATPLIAPSGISIDVPAGMTVTTQAGTATWSKM